MYRLLLCYSCGTGSIEKCAFSDYCCSKLVWIITGNNSDEAAPCFKPSAENTTLWHDPLGVFLNIRKDHFIHTIILTLKNNNKGTTQKAFV